ncbi:MAG: alpha/beta fold hydrolase [Actinomycetota bacterium]
MADVTRIIDGVAVHTSGTSGAPGTGSPLVLLHGNGGDHRYFAAVAGRLAEHHTVHAVDWPGWGASAPDGEPTALDYAALLPRVLRGIGAGPFVLVGNSVGGFAAIRVAATNPDLVRALVLVDPGGFTPRWPGTVAVCRLIGSRRLARPMLRILPRLYLRRDNELVAALRSRAAEAAGDPARVRVFASLWRSFAHADHDARPAARGVAVPTLLVWGRRDSVLPWPIDGRRARHALPGASVVALACGHQAFAEMPDAFLAAVEPFLAAAATGDTDGSDRE